jgi:hypothetical protein
MPLKKSVVTPVIVSLCVLLVAATHIAARARDEGRVESVVAADPVDLAVPRPAEVVPDPTRKPEAAPRRATQASAPRRANVVAQPAFAPAPKAAKVTSTDPADKIALLVGINKAPGSTPLEGSVTDVKNMKKTLLDFGFKESNIEVLTEGKATRSGILNGLSRFAARSKSKGIAVFLLATHSGQSGGDLTFATGGGGRISRHELASHLGRVKGKLWSMLPTCYSAGYALPGVIGKNRIAIFSSNKDDFTWQLGSAGSWLVLYMVRYGMLERSASDTSVEGAYKWAKKRLLAEAPNRAPIINDQIDGDLVLGKSKSATKTVATQPKPKPKPASAPAPTPVPTTAPRTCGLLGGLFGGGCR